MSHEELDAQLDAAVLASVAADVEDPDVIGWLTLAAHQRPDGVVAVWWASLDMDDAQLLALARSLIEELESVHG
jgi:hypothetical protein